MPTSYTLLCCCKCSLAVKCFVLVSQDKSYKYFGLTFRSVEVTFCARGTLNVWWNIFGTNRFELLVYKTICFNLICDINTTIQDTYLNMDKKH